MDIKIVSGVKSGCVDAVASKSYAHRILICAALADAPTRVFCNTTSDDIMATVGCIERLGAEVEIKDDGFLITPIADKRFMHDIELDCRESGSTLRFMLPVVSALGISGRMHLGGRLPSRPLAPLDKLLTANGCRIDGIGSDCINFGGKLTGTHYVLGANVSSQYVTGMLLAMSQLENDSMLVLDGDTVSEGYIDVTLDVLCAFGIEVDERDDGFFIKGGQQLHSPGEIRVEGDWSNSAAWLCCGALSKKAISVKGLDVESSQGDSAVANVLAYIGASVKFKGDKVTASKGQLYAVEIDAENIIDLVPVLSAVLSVCEGDTVIHGISRLRAKESDRVAAICDVLGALGADISADDDTLKISGVQRLHGTVTDSHNDHRIVMAICVAACRCDGEIIIKNADAVKKSYPNFWKDFALLGGVYEELN